jgi:lipopolysaccharide/colanic/teichoic acid biosynthesis glycosyltransferase
MKQRTLSCGILIIDLLWSTLATAAALVLRYGTKIGYVEMQSGPWLPFLAGTWMIWALLSLFLPLDGFRGGWRIPAVLSQLFPAVLALMAMLLAGGYAAQLYISRLALGYFGILLFIGFVLIRCALRWLLMSRYRFGSVRRTVIVGDGALAQEMAATIDRHPEWLCQIVGFLCPAENVFGLSSPAGGAAPVSLQTVGIVDLLQSRHVDEVILTVPEPGLPEILDLAATCRVAGLAVSLVPQPYTLYLSKPELVDLDGLPLLQWEGATAAEENPLWKRGLDLVLTICLLPLAVAVTAPAALALKLRKGKAFRRELRCGRYGKTFWMYRLNSDRDAAVVPTHEFLMQRSSLTELPQLFNVLRGEMSLVGPRPEGPERTRHYSDWHQQRLSAKPGMTGLAQVHGLREQNSSEDKTRYDLQYILHSSPFQDISLLLQTLWTITLRLFQLRPRQARAPLVAIDSRVDLAVGEPTYHPIMNSSAARS